LLACMRDVNGPAYI